MLCFAFMTKHHKTHTCIIYYLSVDFCFSIRSFGLSLPVPLPPFAPQLRDEREEKRNGNDQHKRTLIEFFLCICHYRHARFFLWKSRQRQVCRSREREYDRKRKKNFTILVYFLVFLSIIPYHMSLQKHKFCL